MLTSHHTGNVYPKEKCQRCSIKLCEQRWESKAFQHKVVFVFKFHTFICRDCQSSAVQRRCNSVITPRATGTTEDLRVRAVMGRVCVSLCVHVRMCVCVRARTAAFAPKQCHSMVQIKKTTFCFYMLPHICLYTTAVQNIFDMKTVPKPKQEQKGKRKSI